MSSLLSALGVPKDGQPTAFTRWMGVAEKRLPALIALVAALLYLLPVNQFSSNYDEGVYWQSLRAMQQGHALYSSVFSSQPPYFLVSIYPFYSLFGQSIAAARIGVAVFGVVGVIAIFWLGSELIGFWGGVIAAALLVVEPHYLAQARTLESDGPAVAISILAVALAVAAMRRTGARRWQLAALSGVVIAYGILIKLFDVVALLPIALYLATPLYGVFNAGEGRLRRPTGDDLRAGAREALPGLIACAAGGLAATLVLLAPFLGSFSQMWRQVVAFHTSNSQSLAPQLTGKGGVTFLSFLVLGALALGIVGLAVWRREWRVAPLLLWLIASIVTLSRLNTYFGHYAVLVTPSLALLAGLALAVVTPAAGAPGERWLSRAVMLLLLIVFLQSAVTDITPAHAHDVGSAPQTPVVVGIPPGAQTHIAAINAFTAPGEVVVTDDQYTTAQAGHSVPPELVDTSFVRVSTGYLTAAQIESIIQRDHIRVVILGTARLSQIPGFMPWLQSHYALAAHVGKNFAIYLRVASGPSVA